jgi:hypothetical protein
MCRRTDRTRASTKKEASFRSHSEGHAPNTWKSYSPKLKPAKVILAADPHKGAQPRLKAPSALSVHPTRERQPQQAAAYAALGGEHSKPAAVQ